MIAIALVSLLLRFALEKAIKFNIAQNESSAQSTLKLISAALENFAASNNAVYPSAFAQLTEANPQSYIGINYTAKPNFKGYIYNCPRLEPSGYNCVAAPSRCALTGNKVFSVSTGNLFVTEECGKKE